MTHFGIGRRGFLAATGAALASVPASVRAAPPVAKVTPELIAAALKEGKVTYYSSNDLTLATTTAQKFEAKYPGIKVQLERSGAERNYQRISQEYASNIKVVDVVSSSDCSYLVAWKKTGWLTPYVAEEAMALASEAREEDGFYTKEVFSLMIPAYNPQLVKAEDAPKAWADLLDHTVNRILTMVIQPIGQNEIDLRPETPVKAFSASTRASNMAVSPPVLSSSMALVNAVVSVVICWT